MTHKYLYCFGCHTSQLMFKNIKIGKYICPNCGTTREIGDRNE